MVIHLVNEKILCFHISFRWRVGRSKRNWNDAVLNQERPDSKFRRRPNAPDPSSISAEMEEEKETTTTTTKKKQCFWTWAMASVIFRLVLIHFSRNLNLASRPEVSTPLTSLRRCIFSLFLYDSQTPAHRFLYLNLDLNAPFSLLHCSGRGLLAEAILNFSLCRFLQKFQINLIQIIHLIWTERVFDSYSTVLQDPCTTVPLCCSQFLGHWQFKGSSWVFTNTSF